MKSKKHGHDKFKGKSKKPYIKKHTFTKLEHALLKIFRESPEKAFHMQELLVPMNWREDRLQELRKIVKSLITKNEVRQTRGKRFLLTKAQGKRVKGKVILNPRGFGFLAPEEGGEDYFIAPRDLRGARHGDLVVASIAKRKTTGREKAVIEEIVERADLPIVGRFLRMGTGGGWVYPDDPKMPGPVLVSQRSSMDAGDGDRVLVKLYDTKNRRELKGKISRVFGTENDPNARFKALLAQYQFPENFSEAALSEAQNSSEEITEEELAEREDLRSRLIFTIDPESAHDFDDAISLKKLRGKNFELGVHIADVSWYVRPKSALEAEAYERGTTVYTSHGIHPMLPEHLSSNLCSLQQGKDRRTVSVFMKIDEHSNIVDVRISRSLINSSNRMTYDEVQAMIEKGQEKWGNNLPQWRSDRLTVVMQYLYQLTMKMRSDRFKQGGMNLEVPEYAVVLDEENRPAKIVKRTTLESNHLVEECMLAANRAVTDYATRKEIKGPKSFIFRVHDIPNPDKLKEYGIFIESLGLKFPFGDTQNLKSRQFNDWLNSFKDHPLGEIIQSHALRTLAKAEYSTENVGHYGLGFHNYTHFTSPIRRYPDLVVHRILMDHVRGNTQYSAEKLQQLGKIATQSSQQEIAAQGMERQSMKIRQAEFFEQHIGEEFDGLIVGIIPGGLFVEVEGTGAQGFVEADELGAGYYDRDKNAYISVRGKKSWSPGKIIRVRVVAADTALGQIDMVPV
ncbi:ribonuclease R [bacterium]|nr:ribonuclease R [bacterium]